ncbi:MAG: GntR family transcriptional regulator [Lentisphaeraceae bacterium]|nr:GntR family transcriptional regulator [Lentisphaeraceae bacterium]
MKKKNENPLPLFMQIKNSIYEQIFDADYNLGQKLPTEAVLAKSFNVSRVTVRKALDELKKEGVISSIQGQGTVVTQDQNVSKNTMDTIAVIAGAHDNFLGSFLDTFDREASKSDALVVYKSDPNLYDEENSDTFKTLYRRSIRNCVLWPNQGFDDEDLLHRLRLLGMNLVFFDHAYSSSHADCVTLDNKHAVKSLLEYASSKGHKHFTYLGWKNVPLSSTQERIEAFRKLTEKQEEVLFNRDSWLEAEIHEYLMKLVDKKSVPKAFFCGNGDLAVSLSRALSIYPSVKPLILCVDGFPKEQFPNVICYRQPLEKMAKKAFNCLKAQNDTKVKWQAKTYRIRGEVI